VSGVEAFPLHSFGPFVVLADARAKTKAVLYVTMSPLIQALISGKGGLHTKP
jgi:hypothetical protein